MPSGDKILFVSHKANRSGAPLLLLNLIKEFKKRTTHSFQILLMEDGELLTEFSALGKTFVWQKRKIPDPASFRNTAGAFFSRCMGIIKGFYILFTVRKTGTIFFNTITNGHLQHKLRFLKAKQYCYVHELEAAIHMLTNKQGLDYVLNDTHLFLAVSNAVKQNLVECHSVNGSKIKVVSSPVEKVKREKKLHHVFQKELRQKYSIPEDAILIGISGANEWRKGFSLLIPLTTLYFELYPDSNVYFLWKGFNYNNASAFFDLYDYNRSAFRNKVLLVPFGNDSIECMSAFDIHLLLSREDPYPLVVLEAASFGIPTICFSGGGGAAEFVGSDAGFCVAFGNLLQMATAINKLAEDNRLRQAMGNTALAKLALKHDEEQAIAEIIGLVSPANQQYK
jgi:glycosyltransferase involved in cell wall biosynthesis